MDNTTLRVSFPIRAVTLDPHFMEDFFSKIVILQIHRGLFRFEPSGKLASDLVANWTVSDNKLVYRFSLREAKFSDGSKITAQDVVNSFARIFYKKAPIGSDITYIKGVEELRESGDIKKLGVKAISDNEVEFTLSRPSSIFLTQIATAECSIIKLSNFKSEYNVDLRTPVSGPYEPIQITEDNTIVQKWREDVLDSQRPPKTIEFFETSEAPENLALGGKTDTIDHDPVSLEVSKKLRAAGWNRFSTAAVGERYVILNAKNVDFSTRMYLASKFRSEEVVVEAGPEGVTPAFGLIPAGIPGVLKLSDTEDILRPKSVPGVSGQIVIEYIEKNETDKKIAEFLKSKWETPTFRVMTKELDRSSMYKTVFSGNCNVCITGKGLDYPDGYAVLSYFESKSDGNYFNISSKRIDSMLLEAVSEMDEVKRVDIYKKLQREILGHYGILPLYFGTRASGLWGPRVESVPAHPLGMHFLSMETIQMAGEK